MSMVIESCLFPRRSRFCAITLFGIVFTRDKTWLTPEMHNHERIHCRQQLEWLYVPFFLLYVIEWVWLLLKYRDRHKAYLSISFEREAYSRQDDMNYLSGRRPYANYRK